MLKQKLMEIQNELKINIRSIKEIKENNDKRVSNYIWNLFKTVCVANVIIVIGAITGLIITKIIIFIIALVAIIGVNLSFAKSVYNTIAQLKATDQLNDEKIEDYENIIKAIDLYFNYEKGKIVSKEDIEKIVTYMYSILPEEEYNDFLNNYIKMNPNIKEKQKELSTRDFFELNIEKIKELLLVLQDDMDEDEKVFYAQEYDYYEKFKIATLKSNVEDNELTASNIVLVRTIEELQNELNKLESIKKQKKLVSS